MSAPFTLKGPCANCPFRADVPFYGLHEERVREIAASLIEGKTFYCHKTVDYGEDEDGTSTSTIGKRARACAGALITMEKEGLAGQSVRIAERLGLYDRTRLDMGAATYNSLAEWANALGGVDTAMDAEGNVYQYEHCGVVTADCEDPAGYSTGSGAASNTERPTCNPLTDCCQACGNTVCSACWGDEPGLCAVCADDDFEE